MVMKVPLMDWAGMMAEPWFVMVTVAGSLSDAASAVVPSEGLNVTFSLTPFSVTPVMLVTLTPSGVALTVIFAILWWNFSVFLSVVLVRPSSAASASSVSAHIRSLAT